MSEIKPALTAKEWTEALSWPHGLSDYVIPPAEELGYGKNSPEDMHRVAALTLHDQPFGFTWEDMTFLRANADSADDEGFRDAMNDLADRIAALLPPREEG